jgi:hypothetical protein
VESETRSRRDRALVFSRPLPASLCMRLPPWAKIYALSNVIIVVNISQGNIACRGNCSSFRGVISDSFPVVRHCDNVRVT